jgi:exopolysaccharide production protein ExoZ
MSASKQNANIQALRALAAVLVVVGHSLHETETISALVGRAAPDLSFVYWGFGVDIFFVISGFIMVYTSADLFGQPGAWRIFLTRRLTRIVPLYWLLTTVLLVGGAIAPRLLNVPIGDWQHVLASYAFIPSMRAPGEIRPVMALGWTLNMEMFFYVLFAAALALPYRYGLMALSLVIGGFALIGLVFKPEQVQLAFWTESIILEFLMGCLLAAAYLKGARLTPAAAFAIAALGVLGMFKFAGVDSAGPDMPDALRWGIPALLIVAAAALTESSTSRLMLWLAALGNASYSLYLIHPFVLRPMRNIWAHTIGGALPLTAYVVVVTLLATLVAFAIYRWLERPLLRWAQAVTHGTSAPSQRAAEPAATLT